MFRAVRDAFKVIEDRWIRPWRMASASGYIGLTVIPTVDPLLWFLATENRDIVGVSSCRPWSAEDPEMGWVNEKEPCHDQAGLAGLTTPGAIHHPGWARGGRPAVCSRGFQWNRYPTG